MKRRNFLKAGLAAGLSTIALADNAFGELPVTIRATSREYSDQSSVAKIGLIVEAAASFAVELKPQTIAAGKNVEISIENPRPQQGTVTNTGENHG